MGDGVMGGVYVLCWLLCCVVVNPHKSGSYFAVFWFASSPPSFLFSMPQFALVILLLLLSGRSMRVELRKFLTIRAVPTVREWEFYDYKHTVNTCL